MNTRTLFGAVLAISISCVVSLPLAAQCQRVLGTIGASAQWGSGWVELSNAEFHAGDRLRITVGGTASEILVRVLRQGESSGDPVGILGQFTVPDERVVEVTLTQDFNSVSQISVHGGPNPWGQFPLGGGNGPATIVSVERCTQ